MIREITDKDANYVRNKQIDLVGNFLPVFVARSAFHLIHHVKFIEFS